MKKDYINFWHAFHCGMGFFLLYIALNTAQNIQDLLFADDNYGQLGDYSNAFVYVG